MTKPKNLKFSYNWNNKLNCKAWTTLRKRTDKYKVGELYDVYLKNQYMGKAELISITKTSSPKLNAYVCYLDTGYGVAQTQQILKRMYKRDDVPLLFLLFKWVSKAEND